MEWNFWQKWWESTVVGDKSAPAPMPVISWSLLWPQRWMILLYVTTCMHCILYMGPYTIMLPRIGGRSLQMITVLHRGGRSLRAPKSDYVIYVRPLLCLGSWKAIQNAANLCNFLFYLLHPREGARVCVYWDYNWLQLIIQNCRSTTLPSPPHMPGHGFLANPSGRCVVVKIGAV